MKTTANLTATTSNREPTALETGEQASADYSEMHYDGAVTALEVSEMLYDGVATHDQVLIGCVHG
ncbi:MAG: hypothetical protein SFY80_13630, partial [Verrucomicrobiota bacterium]|nr:hypothetical protein [Verrucomicrobiota bacterium]